MNLRIKNWLGLIGVFLGIILIWAILSWSYTNLIATQYNLGANRTITLSAQGKVYAKPDIAILTFSVITQGKVASEVQKENNQKMSQVVDFIKKNGLKSEDMQTIVYNLNPQYDYNWCRKGANDYTHCSPKIIGYELSQTIQLKIRDFDKIDTVVGGLSLAGANNISNISFTIEDPENYKNLAKIEAINKVKERAKIFSRETGIRLGKIISLSESYGTPYYAEELKSLPAPSLGGTSSEPAPIQTGNQEITAVIAITYQIK